MGGLVVTTLAAGLDIPWAIAFTRDGRLFFTERTGRLRVINGGVLQTAPVLTLPVRAIGEGGLLGLAADPNLRARTGDSAMSSSARTAPSTC